MHTFSKGEKRIHYNPDLSGSVQIVDTKRHVAISLSGDALKEFIESSDLFGALKVEGCYNCVLLEDKEYHSVGTTIQVANQHNRKAIGIELNKDYCNLTIKRIVGAGA